MRMRILRRLWNALSTRESRVVALLLLVTFLKGLIWSAVIPLWQGPDEPTHFAPIQFVAEEGRLPGPEDVYQSEELLQSQLLLQHFGIAFHPDRRMRFSDTETGVHEAEIRSFPTEMRTTPSDHHSTAMHLPPLPYLLGAVAYRAVYSGDLITRAHAARFVFICLTLATVLFAYLICRQVFPRSPAMRLTIPVLVSFQPVFTAMGAVVNSDMLLFFLCTALTYLGVRTLKRGATPGLALWTGLVFGLGILTKPLIWMALPPLGLVWLLVLIQNREQWKRILLLALLAAVLAAVVGGWWMIRSQRLNENPFYGSPGRKPKPPKNYTPIAFANFYADRLRTRILQTYWGYFGWDVYLPRIYFEPVQILLALALAGLGLWGSRAIVHRRFRMQEKGVLFFAAWVFSILSLFAILGFVLARRHGSTQPNHGRYFLGAVVPEMGLLAVGITALLPRRWQSWGHGALRLAAIAFNLLCLIGFVIPRYYG